MKLPFTTSQFLELFRDYNLAVWPLQVVFYLLAIFIVVAVSRKWRHAGTATMLLLGFYWLWMAVSYHWYFFTRINPAAWIFGGLFLL